MFRRFNGAVAVAAFILLSLAAGAFAAGQKEAETGMEQVAFGSREAELKLVFEGSAASKKALDNLLAQFAGQYPNIKVNPVWITMTDWADYFTKIQTMVVGGDIPDVMRVAIEGIQMLHDLDMALPLNPYMEEFPQVLENPDDIHPKLQKPFVIGGNHYGLTWDWNNMVMHFNLDMLQEVGLTLPAKNWGKEEFLEYAATLTRERNGQKTFGLVLPNFYFGLSSWLFNFGATVLNQDMTECLLDSAEAIEAIQFMYDLVYKYKVAPVPKAGDNFIATMISGQTAMVSGGRWPVDTFMANNLNFDVQFLPQFKTSQVIFGSGAFPVAKASKYPEEAYILSSWMSGTYSQRNFLGSHSIPTRISIMEEVLPKSPPRNSIIYRESADIAKAVESPPEYSAVADIFMRYYFKVMADEMGVEEALRAAKQEIDIELSR